MTPPRLANWLLRLAVGREDFEAIAGDFEEALQMDVAPSRGRWRAAMWYWRQVASVIGGRIMAHAAAGRDPLGEPRKGTRMASLGQDLSYALRALRKHPGFTAVAVLTLALGIGANVAIFSLVNAVVLKPLPFADPDRLMGVHLLAPDREHPGVLGKVVWSYPKYAAFRADQRIFDSIAMFTPDEWNVTGTNAPEHVHGESIEATYLATLGVSPEIGRSFTAEETSTPGSAPFAMLGRGFWERRFGGDRRVLGASIGLNGVPHTIVGILPASFRGLSGRADVWVSVMSRPAADLNEAWNHSYFVVARRKSGLAPAQVDAAARVLGTQVDAQFAPPGGGRKGGAWSATAVPMNDERIDPLIKRSVLLMLLAVAAVLLIVCVNIANLILVRGLGRQQEVAIRLAVGASRWRIVRLMMTESALLAAFGGAAGLLIAYGAVLAGAALLPDLRMVLPAESGGLTRVSLNTLGLDWRTMAFTVAMVMSTAAFVGLGPAWRVSRGDLTSAIRTGGAEHLSRQRWRIPIGHALIVVEVALALVLLSAGGLMLKSVARLQAAELGFSARDVLTIRLDMPAPQYDAPRATRLLLELLDRLKANPQVQSAAFSYCAPISGRCNGTTARFPDRPLPPGTPAPFVGVHWASPDYFNALGIALVGGRLFTEQDRTGQPKVVVINEKAAKAFWPNENPIGKRISVGQGGFGDGAEVIGVVADVRYGGIEGAIQSDVYLPLLQSNRRGGIIYVRSRSTPEQVMSAIRQEVRALDPDLPLTDVKRMDARFGDATWRTRMSAWLLNVFSSLALILAAVGIYGVISQSVAQRSRELGVRVALGADRRDILRLVLGRACVLAICGAALGIALAIPSLRLLTALLYQVTPGDPSVLAALTLVLLAVAIVASYLPARRATRVDPLMALRSE
ncbi:MAG TPA: ABC transporter permease [Vicinamibacterales bacterium]